jgi:methylamine dehydrogenase heavy chain
VAVLANSSPGLAELAIDKPHEVVTLPADYPATWVFAHDIKFQALTAGKMIIFDAGADTNEYKGSLDAGLFATFMESSTRSELYIGESYYDRGTRGTKIDMITIYDKSTLKRIDEIILPGNKRGQVVSNQYSTRLVDNDNYLLVFNFTPATSVSIIDIEKREFLNEIPTPGCAMIFPSGDRGFSSLCGDGSMLSISFDKKGQETSRSRTDQFFNIDADPLFDKPSFIGKTAYFPSFRSQMQVIDLSGTTPKFLPEWSLITDDEVTDNWRPGGWKIAGSDEQGRLYMLMHKDGYNGSHKDGGSEVWVYDVAKQKKINTIKLITNGFSIAVTPSKEPLLVVTNIAMGVDVYNLDGELQRTLDLGGSAMPIMLYSKR